MHYRIFIVSFKLGARKYIKCFIFVIPFNLQKIKNLRLKNYYQSHFTSVTMKPNRNLVHIFQGHVSLLFSHSVLSNSLPPHEMQHQASLSFTISWRMLKLISIELVMTSNYPIFYCPFLLLPSVFPRIRVFSMWVTPCIRWPMYWSFSIGIHPSNEYSGLISFRIDWFDLLAVQRTLKNLLQLHSP